MKTFLKKSLITVLALGTFSLANANEMFVFKAANVKIDNKDAKVYEGIPVKVLKDVGNKNALIEFSGIVFDNKIYTNKDKSLLLATLNEGSLGKKGEAKKIQAVIEKGYLTNDFAEIWEEHEEFFYEMCTQCHAAHQASEHSMLEWDAILQTMSGFAQLDEEETNYLSRYLKANSTNGFYSKTK